MPKIPFIEMLFMYYPTGTVQDVANVVGGTVEKNLKNPQYTSYKDTCCIRVSRSLNYAGDPIPWAGGGIGKVRTDKGGDNKNYIYSTYDIRIYLNARYGYPQNFPGTATAQDLNGLQGIIAFGYLHIDLWDMNKCAGHDRFGDSRIANDGVHFWKTDSILDSRI